MLRWLWLSVLLPGLAGASPVLERVVIVSRHGVRAPTKPPAALNPYASQAWPDWPVAPGELTAHGANDIRLMGAWLRAHYAALGLFQPQGCPGADQVFVWADGKDHRTVDSGNALLAGIAPGCGLTASHGVPGATDPVFAALEAGTCALSGAELAALKPRLDQKLAQLPPEYAGGLGALQVVLTPQAAACGTGVQCLTKGDNSVADGREGPKLKGPLATGSSLAEDLSLEYDEGFKGEALGWGRLDLPVLTRIMSLHNLYSAMTRRDPVIGGHNGAVLAAKIIDALHGKPVLPAQHGTPAALTVFLGHDTNLDNLAAVFGLDWQHPDQPDATPPDGELVFELYADHGLGAFVKIIFRYQTAEQLRGETVLSADTPPRETVLSAGGCSQTCTPASLATLVGRSAAAVCVDAAE